ncbi:CrcB family protein [Campylobacter rectus]|uniref:fluoride efflux transporter FluC n=1 Tax=Campylobacter rectus TaxID=203 RepID=UPI0028DC2095|nr:CrcB family protein [Campylobacter rectus]
MGSVCRAVLSGAVAKFCPNFPLATLCVNALGSFLIGVLLSLNLSENLRLFLVIGTLGGFTTFSTFSYETIRLFNSGQNLAAFLNVFLAFLFASGFVI